MRTTTLLLLSALVFASSISVADEPNPAIQLGNAGYAGNGCPPGSLGLALSPDAQSLSIVFTEFEAKADESSSNRFIRKFCDLSIPVHVPEGYSVLPVKGRFTGVYDLSQNSLARLYVVRSWAGAENARERVELKGAAADTFNLDLSPHTELWSPCGREALLRYSFVVQLEARDSTQKSSVRLDALQASPGEVSFLWRKCT